MFTLPSRSIQTLLYLDIIMLFQTIMRSVTGVVMKKNIKMKLFFSSTVDLAKLGDLYKSFNEKRDSQVQ